MYSSLWSLQSPFASYLGYTIKDFLSPHQGVEAGILGTSLYVTPFTMINWHPAFKASKDS